MIEDEAIDSMTKSTVLHLGIVDHEGKTNVAPVGYHLIAIPI
jgi:hypothetical protein